MAVGRTRAAVALGGLSLAAFTFITAETLPIGLLPLIARGLDVSPSAVGLLVSAYALVVVVTTIPLTRLTARVPRRTLLTVLLAVLVVATAAGALSPSYPVLLGARVVTALAQAVFWAVVVPAAAALVAPAVRGRAVSTVYAGQSIAIVLGVPFGTLLGQAVDWRAAFVGVSAIGAIALAVVAALVPAIPRPSGAAEPGSSPDRARFLVLVAATALSVTGGLAAFTYVNPFLTEVSGVPASVVALLLFVRGAAGLVAVLVVGRLVDGRPRGVMVVALALQTVALAVQWAAGGVPLVAATAITLSGAAMSAFSAALGARVLVVAPRSVDVATAGASTAYNVGIMSGAALGGAAYAVLGLAALPSVGVVLGAAGLAVILLEPRLARRR